MTTSNITAEPGGRLLARNALYNVFGQALPLLVGLAAIPATLRWLGEARFEGSSDVRWQGRKLGTLISQSVVGTKVVGAHFNLKRPDLELYRTVAKVPEEKIFLYTVAMGERSACQYWT